MDLLQALRTNELERFKRNFRWKTKDGRTMTLDQMDTTHIFNSMKFLLAKVPTERQGQLFVRSGSTYTSRLETGHKIFFFTWEIENRDDLARNYRAPYQQLLNRIFDQEFLFRDLPPATRTRAQRTQTANGNDDMWRLGTIAFCREFMVDNIIVRENTMDLNQWIAFIPEPFRAEATRIAHLLAPTYLRQVATGQIKHQFVDAFLQRKERAIEQGLLDNRGWRPEQPRNPFREAVEAMSRNSSGVAQALRSAMDPPRFRTERVQEVQIPQPWVSYEIHSDQNRFTVREWFPESGNVEVTIERRSFLGERETLREGTHYRIEDRDIILEPAVPRYAGDVLRITRPRDSNRFAGWVDSVAQVGIDYGEMERRVLGQFTQEPSRGLRGREARTVIIDDMIPLGRMGETHKKPMDQKTKKQEPKVDHVEQLTQVGRRKIQLGDDDVS